MPPFVNQLASSLKYRLFYGYCGRLERKKKSRLKELDWPDECRDDLPPLLIVTCQGDIPLLLHSLRSLRETQSAVPRLWLVGDSDEARRDLEKLFPAAKNVRISHWKDFLDALAPTEKKFVETWVKSTPWGGYAKKFAATLGANRESAVLLSDADVLWKRDFIRHLEKMIAANPAILAGHDSAYAYDREVADALRSNIFSAPPLNCGFVYYSLGIFGETLRDPDYAVAQTFALNATTHLEQTLIAHAFQKSGGQFFRTEEVAATLADNFCLKEKVPAAVRHYAGAKHLFWRDA